MARDPDRQRRAEFLGGFAAGAVTPIRDDEAALISREFLSACVKPEARSRIITSAWLDNPGRAKGFDPKADLEPHRLLDVGVNLGSLIVRAPRGGILATTIESLSAPVGARHIERCDARLVGSLFSTFMDDNVLNGQVAALHTTDGKAVAWLAQRHDEYAVIAWGLGAEGGPPIDLRRVP